MSNSARDIRSIPLCNLRKGKSNPRRLGDPDYAGMAASLKAVDQLQNIIVAPLPGGHFEVQAGDRRFGGFCLLREAGEIASDHPVLCLVVAAGDQNAISAAENMQRHAMHPADECDACQRMRVAGMTVDAIADALGCTALIVERRLAVSEAAPELLALYRTSGITTDQLIALCATDDHALQVSIWRNAREKDPRELRRLVIAKEVDAADDPRVAFIGGIAAFTRAGGQVRRDLFSGAEGGGFIADVALLNRLVCDRLQGEAAQLQSREGWAWVEVEATCNREALLRFGRLSPDRRESTATEQADLDRLHREDAQLQDELAALEGGRHVDQDAGERIQRSAEIADRRDAISDAVGGLERMRSSYRVEEMAFAGAMAWLDSRGNVRVERGLVRPEDRAALAKAKRGVVGGRVTKAAGRKAHAMSQAVQQSLKGYRDAAARIALADNARVAKILFACSVAGQLTEIAGAAPLLPELVSAAEATGDTEGNAHGQDALQLVEQLERKGRLALGSVPASPAAMWRAMAGKTDQELDAILAYGIARMLRLGQPGDDMTKLVLEAMAFDVSRHYTPTAANFFSRVPKEFSVAALLECGRVTAAESVGGMSKQQLASYAESEVRGTGWVPAVMRS